MLPPQPARVGDLVTGQVTKLASFGAFVGLAHDIDGLVHISQVSEDRVDKIKNVLFERIVTLVHEAAPGARLCFNSSPPSTLEAVLRWVSPS